MESALLCCQAPAHQHDGSRAALKACTRAGTGCGWCIPFLKQLHQQAVEGSLTELEQLTPEEYERRRAAYIREGKGTPPPGATPMPKE